MSVLRKGDRGSEVTILQQLLNKNGAKLSADGVFGIQTELAVKKYQINNFLHVDGIAGHVTLSKLGGVIRTRKPQPAIGGVSGRQGVSAMNISDSGLTFLFNRESRRGVSCHLHWPQGASGVTLGPGYDMKTRSAHEIKERMLNLGLDNSVAEKISEASGLTGSDAREFATQNRKLVTLSQEQETSLLRLTVPPYVSMVRSHIFVNLKQYEFDALVSFAYNPGGRFPTVCNYINNGSVSDAMDDIKRAVTSNGHVVNGLVNRRRLEVDLYLNGNYQND